MIRLRLALLWWKANWLGFFHYASAASSRWSDPMRAHHHEKQSGVKYVTTDSGKQWGAMTCADCGEELG